MQALVLVVFAVCFQQCHAGAHLLVSKIILNEHIVEGKDMTVQYTIYNVGTRCSVCSRAVTCAGGCSLLCLSIGMEIAIAHTGLFSQFPCILRVLFIFAFCFMLSFLALCLVLPTFVP